MSKNATDLCTLLVDEVYGELTSRVFKELLYYGRLSFPGLLHHTRLTPRQLRHALTVLIQQHMIYWHTSTEDGVTSYEANQKTSYSLVRAGKYINFAEDRYGEVAGGVISNLLLLGHARIGDLENAYNLVRPRTTNGIPEAPDSRKKQPTNETKNHGPSLQSLHLALSDLLQAGLISIVNESHFRSDADKRTEAERETPNPKALAGKYKKEQEIEWERKVQQKLEDWKLGTQSERSKIATLPQGKKRSLDDSESNHDFKRLKTLLPLTKSTFDISGYDFESRIRDAGYLDDNIVLRINHDKFTILIRNRHLVKLAKDCIGTATSAVYAEVIRKLEPKLGTCREKVEDPDEIDPNSLPQVSTQDLAALLKDATDFASAIGHADPAKIDLTLIDHPKKERRKKISGVDAANDIDVGGHASSDENEDYYDSNHSDINSDAESLPSSLSFTPPSKDAEINPLQPSNRAALSTVRQHLLLLCEHPHHFLYHIPRSSLMSEKWAVDFPALSSTLLEVALAQNISARFGPLANRFVNILATKGKLEEKVVMTFALINLKTVRSVLSAMQQSGYLQVQEIPRDTNRLPSKTLYLWSWDADRARARMLEESYATMSRLLRRARVERERVRETVEKASRTDVVGREDEFLGEGERNALGAWRAREERIWAQVGRLDELVAILRDF